MLFQFKEAGEVDGRKYCFKLQARKDHMMVMWLFLVFRNQSVHFRCRDWTWAATVSELKVEFLFCIFYRWKQVMTNCQLELFGGDTIPAKGNGPGDMASPTLFGDTRQLVKRIISKIQCLPGGRGPLASDFLIDAPSPRERSLLWLWSSWSRVAVS